MAIKYIIKEGPGALPGCHISQYMEKIRVINQRILGSLASLNKKKKKKKGGENLQKKKKNLWIPEHGTQEISERYQINGT